MSLSDFANLQVKLDYNTGFPCCNEDADDEGNGIFGWVLTSISLLILILILILLILVLILVFVLVLVLVLVLVIVIVIAGFSLAPNFWTMYLIRYFF